MYRFKYSHQAGEIPEALAIKTISDSNDTNFSGATTYMTSNPDNLIQAHHYFGNNAIYVGDGNQLFISHTSDACIQTSDGNLILNVVLKIPDLTKKLLYVGKLIFDQHYTFEFSSNSFVIKDHKGKTLA